VFAVGAIRLGNKLGSNWYHKVIRPPGSLPEEEFLKRCVKCGQCMRVCPTNVIQPAGLEGGFENLWTPVLNNRIGSSGCQLNCVACGQVCPTSAIRPITLAEKLGVNEFAEAGPIKMGTAFIDRGRCLPWAMDKPCIVCEENCPLSPKAIFTSEEFITVRDGILTACRVGFSPPIMMVGQAPPYTIEIAENNLTPGKFASGDYYCAFDGNVRWKITANTQSSLTISADEQFRKLAAEITKIEVQVRLQRPYIDIERCIGCGVCEHECPVSGMKAVRVSAEGETRSASRKLLLERQSS
jgi:ferredoxin